MIYIFLYIAGITAVWWVYRVGWLEALKTMVRIFIPATLIIIFNAKAGKLLFRNPLLGIISIIPTAVLIYNASEPIVVKINSWLSREPDAFIDTKDVVDAEVISKEDS